MRPSPAAAVRPCLARRPIPRPLPRPRLFSERPSPTHPPAGDAPAPPSEPALDSADDASPKEKRGRKKKEPKFKPIRSKSVTIKAVVAPEFEDPGAADLQKLRPQFNFDLNHAQYPKHYKHTFETVFKSFRRDQLLDMVKQLDIPVSLKSPKKDDITKSVLEHWGMPSPESLNAVEEGEAVADKEFPLLPSELFLLMGSDGSELMRLSHKFQSQLQPVGNPLRLIAYGSSRALDELAAEIERKKRTMKSHAVELECASGVRPDLIQMMSRMSGAFIENVGEGKIRVTENDPHAFGRAQRLAERAGIIARDDLHRPLISQLSSPPTHAGGIDADSIMPDKYALYPFLIPGALPWTMGYANPFRARRVADWISQSSTRRLDERLDNGRWLLQDGTEMSMKDNVINSLPPTPEGWQRSVSSTPGHLLVSTPGKESLTRTSLVPPIPRTFDFQILLNWLNAGKGRINFLPGVPASVRTESLKYSSDPQDDDLFFRLQYRAVQKDTDTADEARRKALQTPSSWVTPVLEFQINITRAVKTDFELGVFPFSFHQDSHGPGLAEDPYVDAAIDSASAGSSQGQPSEDGLPDQSRAAVVPGKKDYLRSGSGVFSVREGWVSSFDVLLPNRPMDMRMRVADMRPLTKDNTTVPRVVLDHLNECCAAHLEDRDLPESPFSIRFNRETYYLESSAIIRSSMTEQSQVSDILDGVPGQQAKVVVETVTEVDTRQECLQCRVHAPAPTNENTWLNFLSQCEQLTGNPPKRSMFTVSQSPLLQRRLYA